jgi:hypothetical protein
MSVVVGQHVIRHRYGPEEISRRFGQGEDPLLNVWWKTGDIARRSQEVVDPAVPMARPYQKAAKWFYLAWMSTSGQSSLFEEHDLARALDRGYSLGRLGAFVAAYGTARLEDGTSAHMYDNIASVGRAPDHWKPALLTFLLRSIWHNNQEGIVAQEQVEKSLKALRRHTQDVMQGAQADFTASDREKVDEWVARIESQLTAPS